MGPALVCWIRVSCGLQGSVQRLSRRPVFRSADPLEGNFLVAATDPSAIAVAIVMRI